MKKLVIIPAYNESKSIQKGNQKLAEKKPTVLDYVIVNDCSTDDTEALLQSSGFNYIFFPPI